MAKIVIIGGGLTGLSTAYHLERRGFFDYELFEKEETIGGLCRSIEQDGFTFDYTGHLLHTSDAYFRNLIMERVGLDTFNQIQRRSFIYSHEVYTRYPFQINLHGLPPPIIADCIEGYVNRPRTRRKPKTFVQWVNTQFGSGIARNFFLPFQRKIFAYPLTKITPSWTGRFVPQTSLREMIIGAVHDNKDTVGYNAHFLYPKKGGIQYWIDRFAKHIQKPLRTGYAVKTIDVHKKYIIFSNGHVEPFDLIINTMPLDYLLESINTSSTHFKSALTQLTCNSVVNFNLGIKRPDLTEKHWIYFPEHAFPFYRLGFPHNFTAHATPAGCSSLYGEIAHIGAAQKQLDALVKQAIAQTKQVLHISDHEIIMQKIIHIKHAYVIYTMWREKYLPRIMHLLTELGIYSTGRYGAWKYASMQEAVLDGKKAAETVTILPAINANNLFREVSKPTQQEAEQ